MAETRNSIGIMFTRTGITRTRVNSGTGIPAGNTRTRVYPLPDFLKNSGTRHTLTPCDLSSHPLLGLYTSCLHLPFSSMSFCFPLLIYLLDKFPCTALPSHYHL